MTSFPLLCGRVFFFSLVGLAGFFLDGLAGWMVWLASLLVCLAGLSGPSAGSGGPLLNVYLLVLCLCTAYAYGYDD